VTDLRNLDWLWAAVSPCGRSYLPLFAISRRKIQPMRY
jgi:hypothetical protein